MCRVIAVANQKGGVSKTTTAEHLGIGLVNKGFKVLLIDGDAQGSLTSSLGWKNPDDINYTLASVMLNAAVLTVFDYLVSGEKMDTSIMTVRIVATEKLVRAEDNDSFTAVPSEIFWSYRQR